MPMMTNAAEESGEDRLIARYFKPLAKHPAALGLIDDAAALTPPAGQDLVLKADAIVGGIHFFPDDPPETVAQKALRVNLSDLASKGAVPLGFLLSLALPKSADAGWLERFSQGLGADADRYDCPLLGGDTVRSPDAVMVSIAVVGTLPQGTMVKRSGARPGDRIVVTGTIGDAALGLCLRQDPGAASRWRLQPEDCGHLARRYLVPEPRIAIAEVVRAHASAAMDVSDGLAGDLGKLCRASGVSADVQVARVPLSSGARAAFAAEPDMIERILTGGDDFEVVAAVPPAHLPDMRTATSMAGVALSEIGVVIEGKGAPRFLLHDQPLKFAQRSFSHF
ncbi:MAG TPA: thiamine-phosphate kinase [Xanthobacteraceae bacterium]|nr:thiamine-phosphate kinase [Xanthobacteraceae bacterium]